jgi:hypothetical protein
MGWAWNYEPEAFETKAGCYLPDFCLQGYRREWSYVEIKPEGYNEKADPRWTAFELPLLLLIGSPERPFEVQCFRFAAGESGRDLWWHDTRGEIQAAAAAVRAHRFWDPQQAHEASKVRAAVAYLRGPKHGESEAFRLFADGHAAWAKRMEREQ